MIIEVNVSNKIAKLKNKDAFAVCGNSDFVIRFSFDEEWSSYTTKTARFKYNGSYTDVVFNGTDCNMPVISGTYSVEIGVFAGNLHTTTPAILPMKKSILCGGGTPVAPTPDVYSQIMALLNGFSANVEKTGSVATITIVDPTGTHTASVNDGADGVDGQDGEDGADGVGISSIVFKETTASGNVYTVTMTDGTTYEITSPKGDAGSQGLPGQDGADGADGKSAYQSAQDGGYTGTEAQFNTDLAGVSTKYTKPSDGIPDSDLAEAHYTEAEANTLFNAKVDKATVSTTAPVTLADNTIYNLSDVSTLALDYPATDFDCIINLSTVESGTISITFPTSIYQPSAPTFGNGETWTLWIRNNPLTSGGIVTAQKAVSAS